MSGAPRIDVGRLGATDRIGAGGQGIVYGLPDVRVEGVGAVVFKEFKATALVHLDTGVLEAMADHVAGLERSGTSDLLARCAWPLAVVVRGADVVGYLMPLVPETYSITMRRSSGTAAVRGELQHLLNPEDFLARREIRLTDRHRYELIGHVADSLVVFHRQGIVVGDLSPRNLLVSLEPETGVYFVDCDAMRLDGRTAVQQLETPGWEVRAVAPREELATPASDAHKLALVALRLLVGDQSTRDVDRLAKSVPPEVRRLIDAGVRARAQDRPAPVEWIEPLRSATSSASTKKPKRDRRRAAPTRVPAPARRATTGGPPTTAPTGRPRPRAQIVVRRPTTPRRGLRGSFLWPFDLIIVVGIVLVAIYLMIRYDPPRTPGTPRSI
ncbi:MAG: hypothetical protein S0880_28600 [Actinomycetota bacterium]|nr:hypothetical protein [Actinomycetota bacterium]